MAVTGARPTRTKTTEALVQEADEIEALIRLAIHTHWEIAALERSQQSQIDALTVKLYDTFRIAAPTLARIRLEQDRKYQRLSGRIQELRRDRMDQVGALAIRTTRLLVAVADHVTKNAPCFASVRTITDLIN